MVERDATNTQNFWKTENLQPKLIAFKNNRNNENGGSEDHLI